MISYEAYVYKMCDESYLVDIDSVYAVIISKADIVGAITFDSALCLAVEISLTDNYEYVSKGQWLLPKGRVCRKYDIFIDNGA